MTKRLADSPASKRPGRRVRQRGVVLLITLIALVTLALAALALVRSVDTNIIVAGNVSLKQAATLTADNGVESAIAWLNQIEVAPGIAHFNNDDVDDAYYATSDDFDPLSDATWNGGVTVAVATGTGIDEDGRDLSGNRIRYVIQRLCSEPVAPDVNNCLIVEGESDTSSMRVMDDPPPSEPPLSPIYRITARVDGPRNTVSYVQAFVY